jgi:hypothetical protein
MATDYRAEIDSRESRLGQLAKWIPGYGGYKEKEERREADQLLRDHLARQLAAQLTRAEGVTGQMLIGPGIEQLDAMGQGNTRLQTFIDKVKTAAQGYAGLFDPITVKEDQLDALYNFDDNLVRQSEELVGAIDNIQTVLDSDQTDKLAPAVRRYVQTVGNLSALFDQRRNAIMGMA